MKDLKKIVTEYFKMNGGEIIKDSTVEIFIENIEHDNKLYNIHVTKRSLKHFTERRKEDFSRNNSYSKSLEIINLMLGDLPTIINSYDKKIKHKTRTNSIVLYKKTNNHATPMCLVLEIKESKMYALSLHFIKERDFEKIINTK